MVVSTYGEVPSPCNAVPCLSEAAGFSCALPTAAGPVLASATRDILLGALAGGEAVTLDALVRLLPDHPQPLSAVIALVDAGVAVMDLAGPFDASCRVWRSPTRRC